MMKRAGFVLVLFVLTFTAAFAAYAQPLQIDGVTQRKQIYKIVTGDTLHLYIFKDTTYHLTSPRSAIVLFHGGGWYKGSPKQLFPQAEYFASRGMLSVSVEYRIKDKSTANIFNAVKDAKSAINWVRVHAGELGVNSNKIVASGGSAGGHLALCTALISGFNTELTDSSVSSKPDAVVAFNPVVDTGPDGYGYRRLKGKYKMLSPIDHVWPDLPPTLIFHGMADHTVPFKNILRFKHLMNQAGNMCRVIAFRGKDHGFWNYGRSHHGPFWQTMAAADRFLVRLGILPQDYSIKVIN